MHIGDNPKALASVIEGLGGSIVDNETFSFPVNTLTQVVPKLEALGIKCEYSREYVSQNPRSGKTENVAEFTARKV